MFMLKSTMELIREKDRVICGLEKGALEYKIELKDVRRDLEQARKREDWEVEKIKNDVRKNIQKVLIESDLKRVEAVAKLNTYIEMDTKEERKHIQKMLEEAIKALGSKIVTINNK